jgi:hypothetical protein
MHTKITAAMALLPILTLAQAQPLPLPKVGSCPSGYRDSGGYCAPMRRDAPQAVVKSGSCPSGWMQSGAYCVETRARR